MHRAGKPHKETTDIETLKGLIGPHRVITLVGNAKNAGKTTVLNAILRILRPEPVAITSIGLDGELIDNVTALPKPRIFVDRGTIVATAEECLKSTEAVCEVLGETGIRTPLGPVVILRVLSPGNILVAGPSTIAGMDAVVRDLRTRQTGKVLIDGAFSRKSLVRSGEACIFVVGAVKSPVLADVVDSCRLAVRQFSLPPVSSGLPDLSGVTRPAVLFRDGTPAPLSADSALDDPKSILEALPEGAEQLFLPGSLGPAFAREWIRRRKTPLPDLILRSPAHLVLPDPLLDSLFRMKTAIRVLHPVRLIGIAYNPFSPVGPGFPDAAFGEALREITALPVFNVMHESEDYDGQT